MFPSGNPACPCQRLGINTQVARYVILEFHVAGLLALCRADRTVKGRLIIMRIRSQNPSARVACKPTWRTFLQQTLVSARGALEDCLLPKWQTHVPKEDEWEGDRMCAVLRYEVGMVPIIRYAGSKGLASNHDGLAYPEILTR